MKIRNTILTVLVLALVVGGLTGCRNSRRAAAQGQAYCQTPCPEPCPPTCPPVQTYCPPACPPVQTYSPPACPPACPPPYTVAQRPPPPTTMTTFGSPDGGTYAASGGFPAAAPAVPSASSDLMATIQEERMAREAMQQELVAAQERLRMAEQAIVAPPAPCAPPAGFSPAGAATGGSDQAAAFAAALRQRSCGEVEQQGDVVVIRFSDAFIAGSERLKGDPAQQTALMAAAEELGRQPGAFVEVVGHSDSDPIKKSKWRDNVHLSQERAQTVANALAKRGVPAGRLAVTGRGSAEPIVYPEQSSRDKARNRRVEVRVQF